MNNTAAGGPQQPNHVQGHRYSDNGEDKGLGQVAIKIL